MNTPETDVIGGPYIEREGGTDQPIMSFKELSDTRCILRYGKWLFSLPEPELERRKKTLKQQLDNIRSGSILSA